MSFSVNARLKLTDFYIEAEKAVMSNRTPNQVENEKVGGWMNLGYKIEDSWFYNKGKITSEYSSKQFRHVSLEAEVGVSLSNYEIYYRHYSGHMLDSRYETKYPEENSVGIRINLIEK